MANKAMPSAAFHTGDDSESQQETRNPHHFESTLWTGLIKPAGSAQEQIRLKALATLLEKYQAPLKSFLASKARRFGLNQDWADECFQGFVEKKIMIEQLIAKAQRERGRFRGFLMKSLYRFAIDQMRTAHEPAKPIELDDNYADEHEELVNEADAEWGYAVLRFALQALKQDFLKKGNKLHLAVFARRRLPVLLGDPEIEELKETVAFLRTIFPGEISGSDVSNRQVTSERALREKMYLVLSEYCHSAEAIEDELSEICDLLLNANRQKEFQVSRDVIKSSFERDLL